MGKSKHRHTSKPADQSFFWQGLLILLPLVVLATAGFWSLRGQREAVEQKAYADATATAQSMASQLKLDIATKLRNAHPPIPLVPDDEPFPFLFPINPKPPENLESYWRYQSSPGDLGVLGEILSNDPDAQSAAGLPLSVIIRYHVYLEHKAMESNLEQLIDSVIFKRPSILSEPILATVATKSTAIWEFHSRVRAVLRQHLPEIRENPSSRWVLNQIGTPWRIEIVADPEKNDRQLIQTLPLNSLRFAGYQLGAKVATPLRQDYLTYTAEYDRHPLDDYSHVDQTSAFATADAYPATVTAFLTDPQSLYAQHDRQVRWFIGIIAASAFTALVGLWVARRAFLKQQAVNRMKSNFVSSVSHELRAPIASIRLLAERLRAGKVDDKAKRSEYFGFIEQESRRLATLVENVLDFSRIEDGRKTYHFEETDIEQLAADTVQLMMPHALEKKVTLETDFKPPADDPAIDQMEIQQALINLIDNAIKYSPEGETITVGLANGSPEKFQLWVQDHGPGIAREEQQKIFQRFYRVGSELERETQGVGIGLAIVRHTAEAHGGEIALDSALGEGSRFTLELPIKQ